MHNVAFTVESERQDEAAGRYSSGAGFERSSHCLLGKIDLLSSREYQQFTRAGVCCMSVSATPENCKAAV